MYKRIIVLLNWTASNKHFVHVSFDLICAFSLVRYTSSTNYDEFDVPDKLRSYPL